jgi:hypothetical protein
VLYAGVAMVLVLATGTPVFAAESEYVPRADYERLKSEFEQLRQQVRELQKSQQAAQSTDQQLEKTVQAHEKELQEVKQKARTNTAGLLPEGIQLTPGWEKARSDEWMNLGRKHRFDALVARAGDMDLYMGLNTVGRFQYLQQNDVTDTVGTNSVTTGPLEPGIQTPFGQFSFLADFQKAIEVYFDVYIASRAHEDSPQGDEGYILFREIPGPLGDNKLVKAIFDNVDVKAGEFEMDFGDAHYRRSNNADVQRNPLIGNYIIDPQTTDLGIEVYSEETPNQRFGWLAGLGTGNTGSFQNDHGWGLHGKLFGEPVEGLRTSGSVYWVDHSGNPTSSAGGTKDDLFRSNRSGAPYDDVLAAGSTAGQIAVGGGQKVFAAQLDVTWDANPWELYSHIGLTRDQDVNGSAAGTPEESWVYYSAEGIYNLNPRLYLAARYNGASALSLVSAASSADEVGSNGSVHRLQFGGGYWLHDTVLAKVEYVHQLYRDFSPNGSQVSGIDAWKDPDFNGVLAEVSFSY